MQAAVASAGSAVPGLQHFNRNLSVAVATLVVSAILLIDWQVHGPSFEATFDTGIVLIDALIALLLWDVSAASGESLPQFLAVAFAYVALIKFLRLMTVFDMLDGRRDLDLSEIQWRVGDWVPAAFTLLAGLAAALFLRDKSRNWSWLLLLVLPVANFAFVALFSVIPSTVPPGLLNVTRPELTVLAVLWIAAGAGYWQIRAQSEIARATALSATIFALANGFMMYSRAPGDPLGLTGHLGQLLGVTMLLLSLMQIGASETARRKLAEAGLVRLNAELEDRVRDRTARLEEANEGLRAAAIAREQADAKVRAQYERLKLLDQITRAIAARQDTQSIFQVIVGSVESQLPADFVALCLYDAQRHTLTVANVSARSEALARTLGMGVRAQIEIDENGLSRAVRGQLVYEPDVSAVAFPFPQRLARQNLRAVVVSPLVIDGATHGVMIVSRYAAHTFDSTDCEFLKQLSEHAAVAARQARLYTNLQDAYDDLRQTQQAVMQQERLRALGQMASGIAHDINNAISPVALYTDALLERDAASPEQIRSYLDIVKRVTNDVAATVGRLREFYREREPESAMTLVDLNKLAQQTAEFTRARWFDMPQQRGIAITLRCDLDTALPPVNAVEHEIREALTNLVFNAVDALPAGGAIVLHTSAVPPAPGEDGPARVCLEVVDDGVGMDEATRLRCMEPFFTTKGERGTGLGLAMVYGIANRQKAGLEIESTPGKGTTVRLTFAAAAAQGLQPAPERKRAPLRPLRLLVIDDDPAVLESTGVVLELDGHSVTRASGGREGVEAFRAAHESGKKFDCVFTDLGMPHLNGTQVARAIKQIAPETPIVLLTGWGRRMKADDDTTANIDFSLGKPPDLREIREVLARVSGSA